MFYEILIQQVGAFILFLLLSFFYVFKRLGTLNTKVSVKDHITKFAVFFILLQLINVTAFIVYFLYVEFLRNKLEKIAEVEAAAEAEFTEQKTVKSREAKKHKVHHSDSSAAKAEKNALDNVEPFECGSEGYSI